MSAWIQRLTATAAILLIVALTGCGSGSGASSGNGSRASATRASSQASGEAAKPASEILADSEAALDKVHSFHVAGHGTESGAPVTISADVQLPGRLSVTLVQGKGTAQIVVIGGDVYLNANAAYYLSQGGPAAAAPRLAGRWIVLPPGSAPSLGSLLAATEPSTAGLCTLGPHFGTITVRGHGTLDGQPVIILRDAGNVPGSTPALLYLAASGPPLPLRDVQTGAQKPGGTPDPTCDETKADVSGGSGGEVVTLSEFNGAPPVTAPPGAVSLAELAGASSV